MSVTVIIVDGSDRPQVGGTVVIPAQRVARHGRPWLAVAIGLVTAVIAVGANGPQPARPTASPEVSTAMQAVKPEAPQPERLAAAPDRHVIWTPWREYVDPTTGATTRVARDSGELQRLLEQRLATGRPT